TGTEQPHDGADLGLALGGVGGEKPREVAAFVEEAAGLLDKWAEGADEGDAGGGGFRPGDPVAGLRGGGAGIGPGDVDAVAFEKVTADILPEVDELEGGAGGVALAVAISVGWGIRPAAEVQDDAADGVGAAAAVVEDLGPGLVVGDSLVLLEGVDQV